jgi:hypothetical protein
MQRIRANSFFTLGTLGFVLFLAATALAAVAASSTYWATSANSHIGPWRACGVDFAAQTGCDSTSSANFGGNDERFARLKGVRALTIIHTIWCGVGALLSLLIAIRSRRPTPGVASTPLLAGITAAFAGTLALVLFYTIKEDSYLSVAGVEYGWSWNLEIAATIVAGVAAIPFILLVQFAWEIVVTEAGGDRYVPREGVFLTPTSRKAFVSVTSPSVGGF